MSSTQAPPPGGRAPDSAAADAADIVQVPDFVSYLAEQVWYLTESGREMWCRRPYGFFFSSSEAAARFAESMGSAFALTPIGIQSKELVSSEGIAGLRRLGVTRLFIDPSIDPQSGDVFGKILRIEPMQ